MSEPSAGGSEAGRTTPVEAAVDQAWQEVAERTRAVARDLWEHPELCLLERRSADVLRCWLSDEGFVVRPSRSACDTAFVAEFGKPGAPTIGVLLEYDALPAMNNVAEPRRAPIGDRDQPGHGCGHNFIGAVNAGASIAAARHLRATGEPGRIVVFGTPGEELLFGKVAMLAAGDFDDVDALLTHHPAFENAVLSRPCQAVVTGEISFRGAPAHTGVPVSRNALDAAELAVTMADRLRVHSFSGVSIEHVTRAPITVMPSNSPEEIRCWWYVRDVDYARAEACWNVLVQISRTAASFCRVHASDVVISACRGYLPNDVLANELLSELAHVGSPTWTPVERDDMASYGNAFDSSVPFDLHEDVVLLEDGYDRYGQDDGELSHLIPLGRFTWAFPRNIPFHSWAATAYFGTEYAWRSAQMVGRAMTRSLIRLIRSPGVVDRAKVELAERTGGTFERSLRGAWSNLPPQAERFWAGSWDPA